MHASVMAWVQQIVTRYDLADAHTSVLELGSRDVNGSVRDLLERRTDGTTNYAGIDEVGGPGVDMRCSSHDVPYPDASISIIVTTEMLEHDSDPEATFREVHRLLAPRGHLILTTRSPGFPRHDYPDDHYRFTVADILAWLRWTGLTPLEVAADPDYPGVFAHAQQPNRCQGSPPTLRAVTDDPVVRR